MLHPSRRMIHPVQQPLRHALHGAPRPVESDPGGQFRAPKDLCRLRRRVPHDLPQKQDLPLLGRDAGQYAFRQVPIRRSDAG